MIPIERLRPAWLAGLVALCLAAILTVAGCEAEGDRSDPSAEDVEIALYVAIQERDPRIVTSGGAAGLPLERLSDISCRRSAFESWDCTVFFDDEPRVACTIDRVDDEASIDGRVHCK